MTLADYQNAALRTANRDRDQSHRLAILGLGIAGEAGEVADSLKKCLGHGHPLDVAKLRDELGDVLWYVAVLAWELGWSLEDVAEANVDKLRARYPEGFSEERSRNR